MCVCIFVSVRVVGCLKGRVFICLLLCACVCVWWETKLWETEKDRKGKCVTREGTMFSLAGILTSIKLPVSVRHGGVLTGKSRVVMLMFSWQTGTVLKRHGHTATLQHKQKHIFNTAPNLNQLLCLSFWLSLSFFLPLSVGQGRIESPMESVNFLEDFSSILQSHFTAASMEECLDSAGVDYMSTHTHTLPFSHTREERSLYKDEDWGCEDDEDALPLICVRWGARLH